jgi:hypothetical protein
MVGSACWLRGGQDSVEALGKVIEHGFAFVYA